jgi:hypothetical protein
MISLSKPYADHSEILEWIDPNKKVLCYRNLHNGLWSIKQDYIVRCYAGLWSIKQDYIVRCYAQRVILKDCECKVSLAGNARVRDEKRKNVHAVISGYVADFFEIASLLPEGEEYIPPQYWNEITYSERSPKVMGHGIN